MSKKHPAIERFYKSSEWKIARAMKIASAAGRCERCGDVGTEVQHIIRLTPENVIEPEISLKQESLMLLCNECHNKEHERFKGKKEYSFDKARKN